MNAMKLSAEKMNRKERRSILSKVQKLYGIKGDDGIQLHLAYKLLGEGDGPGAVGIAYPLSEKHSDNVHPWLILGAVALARHEAAAAKAFYLKASEIAPKNPVALGGVGKALVLEAAVFEAVAHFERAIDLGSTDLQMAVLYCSLMERMGRAKVTADKLSIMATRCKSAALHFRVGRLYSDEDHFHEAAANYDAAYILDSVTSSHVLGKIKADLYTHHYEEVIARGEKFLRDVGDDDVVPLLMNAYRVAGRHEAALELLDSHEFQTPLAYKRATAVRANIEQDLGRNSEAEETYEQAMLICDEENEVISRAFGVYSLRKGDFDRGAALYAERQSAGNRKAVPYANSEIENLKSLDQIFLIEEQGVGDQLALIPMAAHVLKVLGKTKYCYVGEQRMGDLLEGNRLGIEHVTREELEKTDRAGAGAGVVFLGDLCRHINALDLYNRGAFGGYLAPKDEKIAAFRSRYRAAAGDRPIVGVAWKSSGSMSGYIRSIELREILSHLPDNAYVVSLQYGEVVKEIKVAQKEFPNMSIVEDSAVDQMSDLRDFAAQVAAIDRIVTIDNTTAHVAGALGHPDTKVLLPAGSECMWYWGLGGEGDPWYGTLKLLRQEVHGDWSRALAGI